MTTRIEKLTIKGYKSIRHLESFEFRNLNVLIGANGAGKSNFISFFRLLNRIMAKELNLYVARSGGADSFLYYGRKMTPNLQADILFGDYGYQFTLEPTLSNSVLFSHESFCQKGQSYLIGSGHSETCSAGIVALVTDQYVFPAIKSWVVYHFHDTSDTSPMKRQCALNDNIRLSPDGANLAAYLYRLQQQYPQHFEIICDTVRLVAPFFAGFQLRPNPLDPNAIQLEWHEKGSDFPFLAHHLSDGSLRFICLATVLLQPDELMPSTILIDEPELGLHPYAIELLASLMKQASEKHQLIVSTQSVELLNQFEPEDVIVVDKKAGQSTFERLDSKKLSVWLEEYSLGDLWKRNQFGGRPC
jgi:predicted ATPase